MSENQRQLPPRSSNYLIPALLLGLMGCFGIFVVWKSTLNPVQQHFLGRYIKSSVGKKKLLKYQLYQGKDWSEVAETPFFLCCGWMGFCLLTGMYLASKKKKEAIDGIRLAGPQLVTRQKFNRLVAGTGFYFKLANRRNLRELLRGEKGKRLYFPDDDTATQIMLMGNPRQGKSLLFWQRLQRAYESGWSLWVYDPHMEYVGRLYDQTKKHIIFNPLDKRSATWNPLSEIDLSRWGDALAQAQQMAVSLYPGEPTDRDFFFTEKARELYVHLLIHHQPKNAREFGEWMADPDGQIDPRIANTELDHLLSKNSPGQRNGILAVFSRIANAFRLIPDDDGSRPVLCIREWLKTREGCIFFTSDANTRTTLQPLHSLIIDMGIRGFISGGRRTDVKPTLLGLEEAPTLQELPTLHSGFTESSKTGLNIMMAFQSESQMRNLYRQLTDAIMSAPAIQIYFRTKAPAATKWISDNIGKQRVLQLVRTWNSKGGHSDQMQEKEKDLFMSGDISTLEPLHGVLTFSNYAMRIKVPIPKERPEQMLRSIPFIPRDDKPVVKAPMQPPRVNLAPMPNPAGKPRLTPVSQEQQAGFFGSRP
jgi:hypothetical protein